MQDRLIKTVLLRAAGTDVYILARKSMTVWFYIHSIAKQTEAVALVDSGATENFMNLTYAKWLKLLIKQMEQSRKLFNVDGTENENGELQYYTDLEVRTGTIMTPLRFFLSDLGEHKAILGYPWFAAVQPKIDWKQGWIDHVQLPIIFKTPNAKKAVFTPCTCNTPRSTQPTQPTQYFVGSVTIYPKEPKPDDASSIPKEY
jgi:hypothetical protein